MIRSFIITSLIIPILMGCQRAPSQDSEFVSVSSRLMEAWLEQNPELATYLGDHRWDHRINDYSEAGLQASRRLVISYRDSILALSPSGLNEANRVDRQILLNQLNYFLFSADTLKEHTWNPLIYNAGNLIYPLLSREFAPLPQRLQSVRARLQAIPEMLTAARENLKNPPVVFVNTAIRQNQGSISLIAEGLTPFIEQAPDLAGDLQPAQEAAIAALQDYQDWLTTTLLPQANGDFRIGKERFNRKLSYVLESDLETETILTSAQSDLRKTQDELFDTARPLFASWFPDSSLTDRKNVIRTVLNRLSDNRPTAETIVAQAAADLDSITAFVRQAGLITVPDEPVKLIVMPEFQRGVAVAYCDSPGPLEKNGETFYAISPPPADWTADRVTSYFREYNTHMLRNLTVHEAMPGHYLQLAHSNRYRGETLIRSIYSSGTFVEGWATYAEQIMTEAGYGGPEVKMQQLKMRLRLIINAILDQSIHAGNMTEAEAMALMLNEGFQEEGEAAGKWIRACLSSAQLSTYYVGNLEINDIRRRYETTYGTQTSLKTFHDKILSFGSPAPKYVKQLMGL